MRKVIVLGIFGLCALAGSVQGAHAGCTTELADCYQRAANEDSFWYRWAMGIDCELEYVECARIKLIGT